MPKYNDATGTARKIKQYASGGLRDLAADSPDGQTCARAIELLTDGDVTSLLDAANVEMGPFTGWTKGLKPGNFSKANLTVAFIAYW